MASTKRKRCVRIAHALSKPLKVRVILDFPKIEKGQPFSSTSSIEVMRSTLVTPILAVTITLSIFCDMSLAGLWVCKPCENKSECDADPVDYCIWGEVRDACNRRVCAKGPGERCGGSLNILGQCGEGMMCKSDEKCHGCSIQTMQCYNE